MYPLTLRGSIQAYLDNVASDKHPTTVRTYRTALLGFVKHLESNSLDSDLVMAQDVVVEWIVNYFKDLKDLSPATINVYFWAIYGWLKFLSSEKIASIDLYAYKQTIQRHVPKPNIGAEQITDYYEISRVVNYAFALKPTELTREDERLRMLRDRALILTLADTGIEVSLACRLRKCDIDRKSNRLMFARDGRKASIHVTPRVLETIHDYLNARQHMDKTCSRSPAYLPVFAQHMTGQSKRVLGLNPRSVNNIVSKRASEALGAEYDGAISPKSFRHYAAAFLLQSLAALHPKITSRCRIHYENGHYDDAIFNAMKAIEEEVRIRVAGDPTEIGVSLITNAMKKEPIQITFSSIAAEQDSHYNLFKGAIGSLKNPQSHRFVGVNDPVRAFEILAFSSLLMRMLDDAT